MRDVHHTFSIVEAIPPAVYAADITPGAVDLLGFDAAEIAVQVGVGGITFTGTNKIEFVLSHSDDDVSYAPVTDRDLLGVSGTVGGVALALTSAHAASTVTRFGYVGDKRYIKLLADFGGTHGTGTPIAATVVKGYARTRPVA